MAAFGFASATDPEPPIMPLHFDQYIHRESGAAADPVNLVFIVSPDSDPAAQVHQILGWDPIQGSPMSFMDAGVLEPTQWQMGRDLNRGARWLMRIEKASTQ